MKSKLYRCPWEVYQELEKIAEKKRKRTGRIIYWSEILTDIAKRYLKG